MRKILFTGTILLLMLLYFHSFSIDNFIYAQQAQEPKESKTNRDGLERLFLERIKAAEQAALQDPNYEQKVQKRKVPDLNEADMAKLIQKEINAENEYYKDRVFGNPFRGLAMSIAPVKAQYEIGDEPEISILIKNFGQEKFPLKVYPNKILGDFQYILFFSDGSPVHRSDQAKKLDVDFENSQRNISSGGRNVTSGTEYVFRGQIFPFTRPVGRYFQIEKEGTYFLVAMRRITESWQDGFMISNMTKINIVAKKEK